MIKLDDVSKRFGNTRAVVRVSLVIDRPGVVALLGPNGAGKTTLMRIAAGSITPDDGSVEVAGSIDPASRPAGRRSVGYLPEAASIYPEMSVRGYLRYRSRLFGVRAGDRRRRIAEALDRCELGDVETRRVGTLSKGYRQRVGLAATLLHDPRVVIMDEPSSGLDPTQVVGFRGLVRSLAEERVVMLSTHVLAEAEAVAERVVVMLRGRVVHDAAMEDAPRATSLVVRVGAAEDSAPETDAARLAGALLVAEGVERVEPLDVDAGWHRLRVGLADGADASDTGARVVATLTRMGRGVCEVSPERGDLESRFHALMRGPAGGPRGSSTEPARKASAEEAAA